MAREKRTKVLDLQHNTLLVFGGPYSNLQALESMRKRAEEMGFTKDQVICTGDVVGYCAQPEETVELIKDWGIHVIAGNVEISLREGDEDCGCDFSEGSRCDVFSRQWFPYAQRALSQKSIAWMNELPDHLSFQFGGKAICVLHGNYEQTAGYMFKSTAWEEKERHLNLAKADMVLAGHSGLPFQHSQNGKAWINAGVIGMPANDGQTEVNFMTLSLQDGKIEPKFRRLSYDHQRSHNLMVEHGLPLSYAKTLLSGIWDNCEILPEVETLQQGKALCY